MISIAKSYNTLHGQAVESGITEKKGSSFIMKKQTEVYLLKPLLILHLQCCYMAPLVFHNKLPLVRLCVPVGMWRVHHQNPDLILRS